MISCLTSSRYVSTPCGVTSNMTTSVMRVMTSQRLLVCLQECQIQQLQLNSSEVAAQLTLRDFHLFHDVEPTEYVDELFELDSKYGHPHLDSFSRVSASPRPPPPSLKVNLPALLSSSCQ